MNRQCRKVVEITAVLLAMLGAAPNARAYDYFFEDFSGPALDASRWDAKQAVSGMRWCSDTVWDHHSGPGVWADVSSEGCHGAFQAAPYGAVTFTTDADGTTGASFSSPYPNLTFPFLFAGPGHPRSPFPAEGDFAFEVRLRYEGLGGHGDGIVLTGWPDPTTVGNNPPSPASLAVGGFWGDSATYHPVGVWETLRLEFTAGAYTWFRDGVQLGAPQPSELRPATVWIGNAVLTFWGPNVWSPFTVDYIKVTVPQVPVNVDIKPGSFPNSINLGSSGVVPVAILSSPTFDAATIDPLSVTLASAPVRLKGNGTPQAALDDVNSDGLLDLVVQVSTAALQLSDADAEAIVEGKTRDGNPFSGVDSVRIVP